MAATALLVGAATAIAQETTTIRGIVTDSVGAGISFAVVQTTAQSRVVTDDSGHFQYRTHAKGPWRLLIRRIGYAPKQHDVTNADLPIRVVLTALPVKLGGVVVEASQLSQRLASTGFYTRMADRNKGLGSGSFITIEDIEQRRPLRISQMLDAVSSVRVQKIGAGFDSWVVMGPNGCDYTVYLNGSRLGPRLGGRASRPERVKIDEWVQPSAVAGIEVYPRATSAPPALQMLNGTCGVVAFWTK